MTPIVTTETSGRAPTWVVANRGRGRGGAVGDQDPEAVGAGLGGGREEWDEARVDAGGFSDGGVGGTVPFDREGFFLGHRALGPTQGGGT